MSRLAVELAAHEANEKRLFAYDRIFRLVADMTEAQRVELFTALREDYCARCGAPMPGPQCLRVGCDPRLAMGIEYAARPKRKTKP